MKHEAILNLLSEVTAQRDDYVAWQSLALGRIGKLVDGQPEVRPGAAILDVLDAYVARLIQERDAALQHDHLLTKDAREMNGAFTSPGKSRLSEPG